MYCFHKYVGTSAVVLRKHFSGQSKKFHDCIVLNITITLH
jgi:hypothetical protein